MKILIEGGWWDVGPVSNRQVLREIVFAWARSFPGDELFLLVPMRSIESASASVPPEVTVLGTRLSQQGLVAMIGAARASQYVKPDLVLTQNFAPLFGRAPTTVFLHDRLFQSNPEWFTTLERQYFRVMTSSLRFADRIVTSSRTEKMEIELSGLARTVGAVGLAPGTELMQSTELRPAIDLGEQPFWLSVGRLNVRKNLEYAMTVGIKAGLFNPESPLVVVGARDGKVALTADLDRHVNDGSIVFAGGVSSGELSWLYRRAQGLFFLTRGEGFGLPPVEALAFGGAAVVSDIPVMREVTGGHAVYLPLDSEARAVEILTSLDGDRLRSEAAKGHEYVAETYGWENTVERLRSFMRDGEQA